MEPVWSSLVSNLTPVIGDQSMKDRLFVLLDLYEHLCDEEDVILRLLGVCALYNPSPFSLPPPSPSHFFVFL